MNDKTFIDITKIIAENSTCQRIKVGAVLVKDKRIISMGYNGVPAGQKHCKDYFAEYFYKMRCQYDELEYLKWTETEEFRDLHRVYSEQNELHAEQNAILYAAKNGICTNDTTIYCTLSPCIMCSKIILTAGIKRVVYLKEYDRDTSGLILLENNKIKTEKFNE